MKHPRWLPGLLPVDKPIREGSKPLIDRNIRKMYNLDMRTQLQVMIMVDRFLEECLQAR